MAEDYPENCLRGLPNRDAYMEGGVAITHIAYGNSQPSQKNPGWHEASINWQDDEGALVQIVNAKKNDGEPQFSGGVLRLPKEEIDRIIDEFQVAERFRYERAPVDGNEYHGNLLFSDELRRPDKMMIQMSLARASEIIGEEEIQNHQDD